MDEKKVLKTFPDVVRGTIRVAAPRSIASGILIPMIAEFRQTHPDVHIEILLDDRFTDLVEGKIDVGFRVRRGTGKWSDRATAR